MINESDQVFECRNWLWRKLLSQKDTKALKFLAKEHGYQLKTVEAAVEVNAAQKTRLYKKASERLITFDGLESSCSWTAFKPGTDDLREAPSIDNIDLLMRQGAEITVYDPVAMDRFKAVFDEPICYRSLSYAPTPQEALKDANICFIFTEWDEIKQIKPDTFKSHMRTPLVYDGRNVFDKKMMKENGIEYYSISKIG